MARKIEIPNVDLMSIEEENKLIKTLLDLNLEFIIYDYTYKVRK